ncbi:hypothetical protein PG996_006916 [Apiospora saccharicola]|uniref:Extracellular membrane protein CFEM domain-containing protein n=1 Tax=Apiospora saccharicola TaxID=335842 RepID=A0ABR1VCQ5_9PEZI
MARPGLFGDDLPPRGGITAIPAPTPTPTPTPTSSSSFPWTTPSNWDHKTRVYLDEVPAYWQLPACALTPISTIVRDMSKGCGDGGRLTSYACFCTESHRKARWDISTEISAQCSAAKSSAGMMARTINAGPTTTTAVTIPTLEVEAATTTTGSGVSGTESSSPQEAVSSALDVFEAYCSIGIGHGIYEPSHKPTSASRTFNIVVSE